MNGPGALHEEQSLLDKASSTIGDDVLCTSSGYDPGSQ